MPPSPPRPAARRCRSSSWPSSARATAILAPNERGEIAIRSAANIKGYWKNPEATAAAFTADGYLKTGDIGYVDEDGYLFIVDRKKDIIIRGGENISAAEVEAALYGCEGDRRGGGVRRARRAAGRSAGRDPPSARRQQHHARRICAPSSTGRLAAFKIPGADDLFRRATAPARHRQDRPRRAQAAIRRLTMRLPAVTRRTLLIGGGAGVGLVVAFLAWPRRRGQPAAARPARGGVRAVPAHRHRRAGDAGRAAGRGRPGHLDRAGADRRRRAGRGVGEYGGRAGAARPGLCQPAGGSRLSCDTRRSPPARPRSAHSSSRCARLRPRRGRCCALPPPSAGASPRPNAIPMADSSSMKASGSASAKFRPTPPDCVHPRRPS